MKFFLTSSGLKNDHLAEALSKSAGKPLSELKVLFIPTAANTEGEDKRWLISNLTDFQKYNLKSIDLLDVAATEENVWKKRFQENDIICVGGGNEKYLAEVFAKIGMKDFLNDLPEKIYMGISAGSMVAGKFMPDELYNDIFPEEDFGEATAAPMEILDICFIPHLNSDFFTHIRKDNLEHLKDSFRDHVYSTDDETALVINENHIEIVGGGICWEYKQIN